MQRHASIKEASEKSQIALSLVLHDFLACSVWQSKSFWRAATETRMFDVEQDVLRIVITLKPNKRNPRALLSHVYVFSLWGSFKDHSARGQGRRLLFDLLCMGRQEVVKNVSPWGTDQSGPKGKVCASRGSLWKVPHAGYAGESKG